MNEQTTRGQIDIVEIFKMLFRNWWKIVIASVLGALIAGLLTAFCMTPIYTSRGSLYVNNNLTQKSQNVNLSDLATSQQLAYTYVELLSSDTFIKQVKEYSQLPYTENQLKAMISMTPLNETEIIEIRVNTYYPEHSQTLVDSILNNAQDEIMRIIQAGSVSIVDNATLPKNPSSPNIATNLIIGFMIGFILCSLAVFLIDVFLDNRISDEKDLERVKKLPLLGRIPEIELDNGGEEDSHEN